MYWIMNDFAAFLNTCAIQFQENFYVSLQSFSSMSEIAYYKCFPAKAYGVFNFLFRVSLELTNPTECCSGVCVLSPL